MLEALPLALGLLQTTWIVDAATGPGTNFTDLPPAIAAAASGDTILVRAGSYSAFSITAKALAIRGAGAGVTVVNGPSQLVFSTPAGAVNLFSGMTMHGYLWALSSAHVALLDCEIIGTNSAFTGSGALSVTGQAEVFALRCRFTGGDAVGPPPPPPFGGPMQGGPAVTVQGGKLGAYDCDLRGGNIPAIFSGAGTRTGGSGLAVVDSASARIDSCRITGGDGGPPGSFGGLGGDGIFVRNDSRLQIDGTPADVVAAGLSTGFVSAAAIRLTNERFYGPSQVTVHGALTTVAPIVGPVTFAPDLPPLTVAATTLPSGETDAAQPVNVTFDGLLPSAPFAFMVGFRPDYSAVQPPLIGDLLLDVPSAAFLVGQLDVGGQFQFSFVPAAIFGGAVPIPFYMQFAVFEPSGDVRLSNLDARFYSL